MAGSHRPVKKRRPFTIPPLHKIFSPVDYRISTWLLLGATAQTLLFLALPRNVAALPPLALLLFRIIRGQLQATGYLRNPVAEGVAYGLKTAQYPEPDGTPATTPSSTSIVILVLSASFSHPNGAVSPGSIEIGNHFTKMWRDAERQRERYGYLGNTPALVAEKDKLSAYGTRNGDDEGKTMVWLSYWKTLDGLHEFSHAEAHKKGWLWWNGGAREEYRHIGIAHEVYEAPAGCWENIYNNFRPFGIGEWEDRAIWPEIYADDCSKCQVSGCGGRRAGWGEGEAGPLGEWVERC
jgi:hypothetical protein